MDSWPGDDRYSFKGLGYRGRGSGKTSTYLAFSPRRFDLSELLLAICMMAAYEHCKRQVAWVVAYQGDPSGEEG